MAGGVKFDGEKTDMDLLSPYAMEKIAEIMTYGKTKYGANNWRKGIVYSRLLSAMYRHLNAYRKGQTLDPETGKSHLAHAGCNLMMLLEFEETRPDLDDRFFKDETIDNVELTVEIKASPTIPINNEDDINDFKVSGAV